MGMNNANVRLRDTYPLLEGLELETEHDVMATFAQTVGAKLTVVPAARTLLARCRRYARHEAVGVIGLLELDAETMKTSASVSSP